MQSKRRKVQRCRDETPQQLLAAYQAKRAVNRYGKYDMLRWLAIARTYTPQDSGAQTGCVMDAANAYPKALSVAQCQALEREVATRVMGRAAEYPAGYLQYAAAFFQWWYRIANAIAGPALVLQQRQSTRCTWLQASDMEKSLVVPDVRRSAVQIAQQLAVRAGEFEVVSAARRGRTRAVSAVLQTLRTEEWRLKMHNALMYGTVHDIYRAGLLASVQIAIVHSRYLGRLTFNWIREVLRTPATEKHAAVPWPVLYVHGNIYILSWQGKHMVCPSFEDAYAAWRDICLQEGGVIGGRYDVRKCTI